MDNYSSRWVETRTVLDQLLLSRSWYTHRIYRNLCERTRKRSQTPCSYGVMSPEMDRQPDQPEKLLQLISAHIRAPHPLHPLPTPLLPLFLWERSVSHHILLNQQSLPSHLTIYSTFCPVLRRLDFQSGLWMCVWKIYMLKHHQPTTCHFKVSHNVLRAVAIGILYIPFLVSEVWWLACLDCGPILELTQIALARARKARPKWW